MSEFGKFFYADLADFCEIGAGVYLVIDDFSLLRHTSTQLHSHIGAIISAPYF